MSSFIQLNLHPNIFKAISICGYTNPTPVQARSIPNILEGKDVVASAQTGTGKTAAFVLPALHRLSNAQPSKKTRILILTPTRELASQITKAASLYGKFCRFNIVSLVGGMPYHHQIRDLARGADIIVATPGRLLDHIESQRVDLSNVEMLVLDEADRMLDMGFIDDVEHIAKLTPAHRQTLLFSATVDKELSTVVRHLLKNPIRIDLSNEKVASPQITQELYKANNIQHKSRLLKHFLNDANIYKAIIFSATKINADKLANQLRDEGFAAAALHGDLRQNVRNRTIEQLRRGKIQFLVATDVAARGIDISDITHVINYDLPRFCEDYVHRIGRTGRAGKTGIAISFVLPADSRNLQRIERYIGQRLKFNHVDLTSFPSSESTAAQEQTHGQEKFLLKKERHFSHERRSEHQPRREKKSYRENNFHRDHAGFEKKSIRKNKSAPRFGDDNDAPAAREKISYRKENSDRRDVHFDNNDMSVPREKISYRKKNSDRRNQSSDRRDFRFEQKPQRKKPYFAEDSENRAPKNREKISYRDQPDARFPAKANRPKKKFSASNDRWTDEERKARNEGQHRSFKKRSANKNHFGKDRQFVRREDKSK